MHDFLKIVPKIINFKDFLKIPTVTDHLLSNGQIMFSELITHKCFSMYFSHLCIENCEKSVYFWTKKCVKNHKYVKLSWKPHIAPNYWCQFLKIQLIIFNLRYYTYWRYVRFLRKSKFKKVGFLLFSCFLNARRIFLNMRYFENDVTQWKINRLTWNFFYRLPSQ